MGSRQVFLRQHVPLRVPSNWNIQEKMLITQLEEVFEDIYKQYGRLKLEDMSTDFRKLVDQISDDSSKYVAEVAAGAYTVTSLTDLTGIEGLNPNETLLSRIEEEDRKILSLISKTGVNNLQPGETLYSKIDRLITRTGINNLQTDETLYAMISKNTQDIEELAGQITPDDLSWQDVFEDIGAGGYTPSGITEIGANGITVGDIILSASGYRQGTATQYLDVSIFSGVVMIDAHSLDLEFGFRHNGTDYTISMYDIWRAVNGNT